MILFRLLDRNRGAGIASVNHGLFKKLLDNPPEPLVFTRYLVSTVFFRYYDLVGQTTFFRVVWRMPLNTL